MVLSMIIKSQEYQCFIPWWNVFDVLKVNKVCNSIMIAYNVLYGIQSNTTDEIRLLETIKFSKLFWSPII